MNMRFINKEKTNNKNNNLKLILFLNSTSFFNLKKNNAINEFVLKMQLFFLKFFQAKIM